MLARGEIVEQATYKLMLAFVLAVVFDIVIPVILCFAVSRTIGILLLVLGPLSGIAAGMISVVRNSKLMFE